MRNPVTHRNVFVTGERGLLGSALLDQGCNCIRGTWDITEPQQSWEIIYDQYQRFGSDLVIINCAGKTNVDWVEGHPFESMAANLAGPTILVKTLEQLTHGKAKLVHISTDFVFDGRQGPYSEVDGTAPRSVYGMQKCLADSIVREYDNHLIIRTTALYGPHGRKRTFVHWLLDELNSTQRKPVVYMGQATSPTYAPWLAETILALLRLGQTGTLNAVGDSTLTRYSWARCIAQAFGYNPNDIVGTINNPIQRARRPEIGGLTTVAIRSLGIVPPALSDSLKECAAAWK